MSIILTGSYYVFGLNDNDLVEYKDEYDNMLEMTNHGDVREYDCPDKEFMMYLKMKYGKAIDVFNLLEELRINEK